MEADSLHRPLDIASGPTSNASLGAGMELVPICSAHAIIAVTGPVITKPSARWAGATRAKP